MIASCLFFGCSKDTLTNLPETVVSADDFYKTEEDFRLANVGVYAPLRPLYGVGLADRGAWTMGEMRSDNTCFIYNEANRGYVDIELVEQFSDDSNGGPTANKYQNDYIIIGRANQVLDKIDAAEFDQAQKDNYKGQALFLRAFAYFDLVQYYGSVPLVLTPPTSYEETIRGQSPVSEIYAQIIADAELAANLLPGKSVQSPGFVADGAAWTLLGNIYMVLEQWANAKEALLNVEGYALMDDYAAIFDPVNKNNQESIFEVQYWDDPTAGVASSFAYNFLPVLSNPGIIPGFPDGNTNSYAGWNTPTPEMIDAYEADDLRFDASIELFSGDGYDEIPYIKKYVHGSTIAPNTNDNWPVYRYAEVLLFLAEAENELGNPGQALNYLNMVHAHSRTGLDPITETGQSQLRELILEERRIELAFENKRWTDLIRTDRALEVMSAHTQKILANPTEYYYPEGVSLTGYDVTESRLLFPIPQREIEINPDLEQNPGY